MERSDFAHTSVSFSHSSLFTSMTRLREMLLYWDEVSVQFSSVQFGSVQANTDTNLNGVQCLTQLISSNFFLVLKTDLY